MNTICGASRLFSFLATSLLLFLSLASARAQGGPAYGAILEAAKREGKVVVSVPASAEFRKQIEEGFKKRFGIDVEVFTSRASSAVRRMADEFKAGVKHFDLHIGGSSSAVSGLLDEAVLDPVESLLLLPEVREPKQWWGGHLWVDSAKKYIYGFNAYLTESIWYNSDSVRPAELRSYDDFLNPKWQGRIGFLDPRSPGAGDSNWSFIWDVKGEEYLKKLVAQDLVLGRDQRVLADQLAKGKISVLIGLTYYSFLPFIKAGLPIKPLPTLKDGTYGTGGSGNLAVIKNPPHPNATKIFVNWLLSREGQELSSKALGQATRRLDVDTKALKEIGVLAAKDVMTLEQYLRSENQSEEKLDKVREPALRVAQKLLH